MIGATLCSSTAALARALEEHEWARPLLVPIHVRQELVTAQYVDECPTTCSNVGVSMEQQYVRMTPIHWQAREQQEDRQTNPNRHPPSDLPPPPDPEPHANVPGPTVPPSDVPTPTQPGLPPPMPEPARAPPSTSTATHATASRATTTESAAGPQSREPRCSRAATSIATSGRTRANGLQRSLTDNDME